MGKFVRGRYTAQVEEPFVVFVIGLSIHNSNGGCNPYIISLMLLLKWKKCCLIQGSTFSILTASLYDGNTISTTAPPPGWLAARMLPPHRSTMAREMASPRPVSPSFPLTNR